MENNSRNLKVEELRSMNLAGSLNQNQMFETLILYFFGGYVFVGECNILHIIVYACICNVYLDYVASIVSE